MKLLDVVRNRTIQATGMTKEELKAMIHADESVLHDPFLYDGMTKLVTELQAVKERQSKNSKLLLVIDTDYDTDGVMSAAVLSAALDVFNINYRIYIPSMSDGYGLSKKAIYDMKSQFEGEDANGQNQYKIDTILTADNGTNAIAGVDEANINGIHVLVTDHHLGGTEYSNAEVIINPNKLLDDGTSEPYPFKGNSGAAVAWKAMMAYAKQYMPETLPLISDLIVFAGIADVSDVMPILDENHYMVKQAVIEIQRLININSQYKNNQMLSATLYDGIKHTKYPHYNAVFYGLYDMITLLQKSKDDKRLEQHKKPIPLTNDEELISWYLSPMINAPRRIHATSLEAMISLMSTSVEQRQANIAKMIAMNAEKSDLRNAVTDKLSWEALNENYGNVLFVNAQHGISGLIAGQVTQRTGKAAIVFALPTALKTTIYDAHQFDGQFNADSLIIAASARSTQAQPLNVIMSRINEIRPDIIVGGGGHAAAAGYSIKYSGLSDFTILFNNVAKQVAEEIQTEYAKLVDAGEITPQVENVITLALDDEEEDTPQSAYYNLLANTSSFAGDMLRINSFQNSLKPFGKDFNAQTNFRLNIIPAKLLDEEYNLNLNFWKTLKFNLYGVDVLTFNIELANMLKELINEKNTDIVSVNAKLVMNNFRGRVTPQLQLEP